MAPHKKLFLSAVSSEFLDYRELLAKDLRRPDLDVAEQEAFVVSGASTLENLDDYIRQCHGVVHIVGKARGLVPPDAAVRALLARYPDFTAALPPIAPLLASLSYTQWEAWLALYHRRPLFIYRPVDFDGGPLSVPRHSRFVFDAAEAQSQADH